MHESTDDGKSDSQCALDAGALDVAVEPVLMSDVNVANDRSGWPVGAEEEHVQDVGEVQKGDKIVHWNHVIWDNVEKRSGKCHYKVHEEDSIQRVLKFNTFMIGIEESLLFWQTQYITSSLLIN